MVQTPATTPPTADVVDWLARLKAVLIQTAALAELGVTVVHGDHPPAAPDDLGIYDGDTRTVHVPAGLSHDDHLELLHRTQRLVLFGPEHDPRIHPQPAELYLVPPLTADHAK